MIMGKIAVNSVLLVALVLPVAVFLLLFSRTNLSALPAAAISVASGWALNVTWAAAADPRNTENYRPIALRFGWACPAVLVLATWAILHFFFHTST